MLICSPKIGKLPCDFKTKTSEAGIIHTFIHVSNKCLLSVYYTSYALLDAGDREMSFCVHLLVNDKMIFPLSAAYFLWGSGTKSPKPSALLTPFHQVSEHRQWYGRYSLLWILHRAKSWDTAPLGLLGVAIFSFKPLKPANTIFSLSLWHDHHVRAGRLASIQLPRIAAYY